MKMPQSVQAQCDGSQHEFHTSKTNARNTVAYAARFVRLPIFRMQVYNVSSAPPFSPAVVHTSERKQVTSVQRQLVSYIRPQSFTLHLAFPSRSGLKERFLTRWMQNVHISVI